MKGLEKMKNTWKGITMEMLTSRTSGNYYEALKDYNGSEDKEQYAKDIITWAETEGDYLQME